MTFIDTGGQNAYCKQSVNGICKSAMPGTGETRSDSDLERRWAERMAAAQAGDRVAYELLLRECIPFIATVARASGVGPEAVDDVVQETLITVHRARHTYDPSRSFRAWLRTIAGHRAIDVLRRQRRSRTREVHAPFAYEAAEDDNVVLPEALDRQVEARTLRAEVASLPAGQREAVEQLALKEQSLAEAAGVTGRSVGALKVNLHRGLKALRARLMTESKSG